MLSNLFSNFLDNLDKAVNTPYLFQTPADRATIFLAIFSIVVVLVIVFAIGYTLYAIGMMIYTSIAEQIQMRKFKKISNDYLMRKIR